MLNFKRGDTFLIEAQLADNGIPTDLTNWTIRSQVRRNSQLIDTLDVTIVDAATGRYTLSSSGATTAWPIAVLESDIEYTSPNGQIVSTETYSINCVKDVTI